MAKKMLVILGLGQIIIASMALAIVLAISPGQLTRLIPGCIMLALSPLLIVTYKHKKYLLGVRISLFIFIAVIATAMTINGGITAPAYYLFYPLVALAAWIYGAREAMALAGAAILFGLVFWYLGSRGIIPMPPVSPVLNMSIIWLCLLILLLSVCIPSAMLHKSIAELERSRERHQEARRAAEKANQGKSVFLSNMSHELRTPLNGLMGMLQLLETTRQNDEQRQYTLLAKQSCHRLTRLMGDLLDMSCIESGKMDLIPDTFAIADTARTLEQVFRPVIEQAGIGLRVDVDPDVPERLRGDAVRLSQILNNLVGNALKYTERGGIEVRVSTLPTRREGEYPILFEVSDTGIGIPDKLMDSLFDPFIQGENSFTRRFQGAGLGLSIVKRLVTLMGGSACVDSEEGVGTRFYISLPFGHEPSAAPRKGYKPLPEGEPAPGAAILLVEDDDTTRLATARCMELIGFEVATARNGAEALDMLRDRPFDCVLMDIQMPVMDGVETTRAIRNGEAGEGMRGVPIIAMTAYAMTGDEAIFLSAGMDDYIAKPIEMDALEQKVRSRLADESDDTPPSRPSRGRLL